MKWTLWQSSCHTRRLTPKSWGVNYGHITQESISSGQGQKKSLTTTCTEEPTKREMKTRLLHQEPLLLPNQNNRNKMKLEINEIMKRDDSDKRVLMTWNRLCQSAQVTGQAIKATLPKRKLREQVLEGHRLIKGRKIQDNRSRLRLLPLLGFNTDLSRNHTSP